VKSKAPVETGANPKLTAYEKNFKTLYIDLKDTFGFICVNQI